MIRVTLKPDSRRPRVFVFENFQQMEVESGRRKQFAYSHTWQPPTDVYEIEGAVVVRVEVAGMRETDFHIMLEGNRLTIRGFRQEAVEKRAFHQMEIRFGEFLSEVELPCAIVVEKIEALYQAGLLRITLPKAAPFQVHVEE